MHSSQQTMHVVRLRKLAKTEKSENMTIFRKQVLDGSQGNRSIFCCWCILIGVHALHSVYNWFKLASASSAVAKAGHSQPLCLAAALGWLLRWQTLSCSLGPYRVPPLSSDTTHCWTTHSNCRISERDRLNQTFRLDSILKCEFSEADTRARHTRINGKLNHRFFCTQK